MDQPEVQAIEAVSEPEAAKPKTRTNLELFVGQYQIACASCPAKGFCPRYEPARKRCWYLESESLLNLGTAKGIIASLEILLQSNLLRYRKAVDIESRQPQIDPKLTSLSAEIRSGIEMLEKLSVRFGLIEAEPEQGDVNVYINTANVLALEDNVQAKLKELRRLQKLQSESDGASQAIVQQSSKILGGDSA